MKNEQLSAKTVRVIIIVILLFVVASAGILYFAMQKPVATVAKSLRFPVGSEVSLSDIVTDVENGTLVDADTLLDSSKAGKFKITFALANSLNVESEESVVIEFYDPDPAEKPTDDKDNDDEKKTENEKKTEDEKDNKNNTSTPNADSPFGADGKPVEGTYKTKTGKTMVVKDGLTYVDGYLLVNKSYPLPKNYTAPYLLPEAEQAYYKLRDAAKEAGFSLPIKSAYRSWNDQNYIFNGYVRDDGLEEALTYSARPGHSEHQTGLAMDLLTASTVESKTEKFKPTLDWLAENAHKYGFILRYPNGKSDITGYIFEPWHYRYVGTELAEALYNDGDWITMEEYFGVDSVYRGY